MTARAARLLALTLALVALACLSGRLLPGCDVGAAQKGRSR